MVSSFKPWTFYFGFFKGKAKHEFKTSTKYLFTKVHAYILKSTKLMLVSTNMSIVIKPWNFMPMKLKKKYSTPWMCFYSNCSLVRDKVWYPRWLEDQAFTHLHRRLSTSSGGLGQTTEIASPGSYSSPLPCKHTSYNLMCTVTFYNTEIKVCLHLF